MAVQPVPLPMPVIIYGTWDQPIILPDVVCRCGSPMRTVPQFMRGGPYTDEGIATDVYPLECSTATQRSFADRSVHRVTMRQRAFALLPRRCDECGYLIWLSPYWHSRGLYAVNAEHLTCAHGVRP